MNKSIIQIKIDRFILNFPTELKFNTFTEKSYYGVNFTYNKIKYEVIHNYAMGTRLLITGEKWNDIPFKEATIGLLPDIIKVDVL